MLELLRAIFNRLKKMGLISLENPAAGVEKFREQKRDRFLQADEIPRFFAALSEVEGEATRDALLLLLLTGARRSNVLAMRWEDLDLTLGRWRVPSEHSKNGDVLVVPLTSATLEILKRRQQGASGEYVFPSDSKTGYITPPKGAWQRLLKRADLTGVRLHDLRRSLASWMVIEGASLVVTGGALGHKDPQSTAIYARLSVDPVKHAMEKAQAAIFGLAQEGARLDAASGK
ncbi:MAG TPA: site-specific integrase [Nitrospira sp.]|nr:site-specific integrase [Nitrospira sp.]